MALGGATALPYFHLGSFDVGVPIQAFGVIVAIGVLIGAGVLRRYAEWHGVSDDHIRGITGWVTVAGFIGAHVFDVLFYQWNDLQENPILLLQIWKGISSYGGFLGGAIGWWIYVWWKRLDMRLLADVTVLGLLVAFSIGRIGCTVVSDHIGAAVDPSQWYAALAVDYPRHVGGLGEHYTAITGPTIRAWNLGLLEFLYLVPVNIFMLWYAFRSTKRPNAGMITALTGLFYAPVRFLLDFLRFNPEADPRYLGLTFAQWVSILAFGASVALVMKLAKNGKPAETVGPTSGEVQRRLKLILKEDDAEKKTKDDDDKKSAPKATAKEAEKSEDDDEDEELAKEAEAAGGEGDDDEEDERPAPGKPTTTKPGGNRPRPQGGGSSKKNKKKRR
ncbi:MAG TPA: prolipoprotein diacylglyceryl transferase family protein [Kofleriaceae bacterium]|nr:prolipoprotein diacylglyceryl transferase family protein [Kofleriaceae bacterium]